MWTTGRENRHDSDVTALGDYGKGDHFDPDKFSPVENRQFVKPTGGLWASPINANHGWREWCVSESFGDLSTKFEFDFEGKTLVIDSAGDLDKVSWVKCFRTIEYPGFEKLAKKYDAIYLTEKGQWETRFSNPRNLYGWDCECVLVLNPNCIRQERTK